MHFRRAERHDRLRGGQKPGGKVGVRLTGTVIARRGGPSWGRGTTAAFGYPDPRGEYDWQGLGNRACRPLVSTGGDSHRVALGLWRICRHSTRPVLKHGPRSLTCARVIGLYETQRRSESEGRLGSTQVGSVLVLVGGAPPARPVCAVSGAEQERTRWDPKDGELCLSRTKPEETLVEVRSDSDVQIDRQTWV